MTFTRQLTHWLQQEKIPFQQTEEVNQNLLLQLNGQLFLHLMELKHAKNLQSGALPRLSARYEKKGQRIIHLYEDIWVQQQQLVKARILALMGKRKRLHARQTAVARIDKKQADDFLNRHHLQHSATAYYKYAQMVQGEPVAVALFSKSRTMHDGAVPYRSYELVRFASRSGVTVTGGLSKLLTHFIREHHPAHLMTYADRDWSNGESYRKLGFTFAGFTPPQLFYVHPDTCIRYYPHRLPAGFSNEQELLRAGYLKIYNSGNSKWHLHLLK